MRLYHFTPSANLPSITHRGLLLEYACSWPQFIWLCSKRRSEHVMQHIAIRHRCEINDLAVLTVDAIKFNVRRSPWQGVWRYTADLPYCRIAACHLIQLDVSKS